MMHKFWCGTGEVLYCFSRSSITFQGLNWAFPDCNLSSSINFQGHTGQIITYFDRNLAFLNCNSSSNLLMALKWCTKFGVWYRRGALLFFEVIHQISRSHRLKNLWFESHLNMITRPVAPIKSLRFALFLKWPVPNLKTKHTIFWLTGYRACIYCYMPRYRFQTM